MTKRTTAKKRPRQTASFTESLRLELVSRLEVRADDIAYFFDNGRVDGMKAQSLARGEAWLRLYKQISLKEARAMGMANKSQIFDFCMQEQAEGRVSFVTKITNERTFQRNANKDGRSVNWRVGNANAATNPDSITHAKLVTLAANPIKLSFEDIGLEYNTEAEKLGLKKMGVSAIKRYLNKPEVKRVWYYKRHGKLAGDLMFKPEIQREQVSRPDALWSLDGTPSQMYYVDKQGNIKSDIYAYFVTDVYSSSIIGCSLAFSETSGMVAEALKDAVETHGYKPYQLQYDGSSANVSRAMQALMSNMSRVQFPCQPYSGQSKYVETYIGHFQQQVLRKCQNFKGGNVTTKSLNSKANPELLAKYKKNPELLPTEEELIVLFHDAIDEWNNRGESRDKYGCFVGETKIERYQHEHADREKLSQLEVASLFMVEQKEPYTYGKQGVAITLNGKKHNFIVPDDDGIGDFMFSRYHIGEQFAVRLNLTCPDFITLWKDGVCVATAYEKEKYSACVADEKRLGDGGKKRRFWAKQEEFGYEYSQSELERQREILEANKVLRATGTDGFGWWDTPKSSFNAQESLIEDRLNGMASKDDTDPALKALLNM